MPSQEKTDSSDSSPSKDQPAWKAAEEYGCDLSLIESNLRKTPKERIRNHNRALKTAIMLREAKERADGRS